MIRGWYTGASGMAAQQAKLDSISNNLANLDTDGYKKDITVHKAFSELLLRRMGDDGVYKTPFGSADVAPIIGKLGLGVETNELFTEFGQGSLKDAGSDFSFALEGKGFFCIETPYGERYTRNGSFVLGKEGFLETKEGYRVLGEKGPISVKENNFMVDKDGNVFINESFQDDPTRLVSKAENGWDRTVLLDKLKLVDFDKERFLAKQGSSMWKATGNSGEALPLGTGDRPGVHQGYLEASNVNPIEEMVQMIEVNRAYEANSKTVQEEDALLGKLVNEVVKF